MGERKEGKEIKRDIVILCLVKQLMIVLTEYSEREQQVLEKRREAADTLVPGPGLDGLQVTFVHPHLHLLRHDAGTVSERKRETERERENREREKVI